MSAAALRVGVCLCVNGICCRAAALCGLPYASNMDTRDVCIWCSRNGGIFLCGKVLQIFPASVDRFRSLSLKTRTQRMKHGAPSHATLRLFACPQKQIHVHEPFQDWKVAPCQISQPAAMRADFRRFGMRCNTAISGCGTSGSQEIEHTCVCAPACLRWIDQTLDRPRSETAVAEN